MPGGRVQVDEAGLVQVDNDNAVFLSDQGYIVRYHASGVTVSMMDDTESLVSMHAGRSGDGNSGAKGTQEACIARIL